MGGDSWLQNLASNFDISYIDFAGSSAIHMVGGCTALIGAIFVGPRLGKYTKKADGSVDVKAIPGHNILVGASLLY
jgi:Amt family ammonium transporter